MLTWEHVVKFQKFPLHGLQDISIQIHLNHFFAPMTKVRQLHDFTSSFFYKKSLQEKGVF